MPGRRTEGWDDQSISFTSNTTWLESVDADRRAIGPEELLSGLEDLLLNGELSEEELIQHYQ